VTYRAYIKKDYKAVIRQEPDHPLVANFVRLSLVSGLLVIPWLLLGMKTPAPTVASQPSPTSVETSIQSQIIEPLTMSNNPARIAVPILENDDVETVYLEPPVLTETGYAIDEQSNEPTWQNVKVKKGESLARIFKRLKLSAQDLHSVMMSGEETLVLKYLQPDQILQFDIEDNQFKALKYAVDLVTTLHIVKTEDGFHAETLTDELETHVKHASVIIDDSLFLSGIAAGLSDNLIMQLVAIYGWDIDFALDIRSGDHFSMIYEERYKNGSKVSEGPIIAAEFVNRKTPYRAIRYTHEDGHSDYYSDTGSSMRKAFLRTPVNFTRISSRFNMKRKHPILNMIRAHRGVDYAAPSGTPVKVTGDGTVTYLGKKGRLGKTIILKHGGQYDTVYAHLSGYKKGLKSGKRVKQGQIIGYVGMTGLASGPHLHYEFRVNGVHRNPLKVKLPKANGIPAEAMKHFITQIEPLLAELDSVQATAGTITRSSYNNSNNSVVAMQSDIDTETLD
jgi:murein DD-endopeptidase MepM/ murein hydrolase activator NlpD